MKKLKILFVTRNDREYIVPASHYFIEELGKLTNLHVTHQSGDINKLVAEMEEKPDFIYINDYLENGSPVVKNLKQLKLPFAVGLHDLHYQKPYRKAMLKKEEVQHIFTYYRDKFLQWYPEFSEQMHWLPHHAHSDIYCDYHQNKDIDVLMMGSLLEDYYPLRVLMQKRLDRRPGFVYHSHPGYRNVQQQENNVYVGTSYAKELNRAKISLTCDSVFKYPLMKYFEITACNTLLLAPYSKELGDLGFIPGVNFVSINEQDFEEKMDYYLENEAERQMIAHNGMYLSQHRHSTKQRAQDFLDEVVTILTEKPPSSLI
ncbi:glycosyltransferase [Gracilibacillus phocaeensis]|uniref:glycosyltransferase n=1 Tax=Gracilibacillus phocaeensis TaxID=2042304 RepID=UPI00103209AD|nr:glycosyltransferase [Gracilibacillus phocaeensis]